MNTSAALFVGTSGWQYPDWKGDFYPDDVPQRKFLEYYTTRFEATELNASFYRLPSESMIEGWLDRTPQDFRFCLKLSRLITHNKRLADCEEALGNFIDRIKPLAGRMGPVLAQLPPSMAFDEGVLDDFAAIWAERFDGALAVEARHESWMEESVSDWLVERGITPVIADSGLHTAETRP